MSSSLVFSDIGARWGVSPHWKKFSKLLKIINFEPDSKGYQNLLKNKKENEVVYNYALTSYDGIELSI